jgi:geranylgeranyl diphosphate synthase type I
MELFHTFALVHDDVMDDGDERRGVAATHRRFAKAEPGGEAFGRSAAILVGDLAFALAVDLVFASPVPAERAVAAVRHMRAMALATAAGQYLDVAGAGDRPEVSALKTAAYTAEGPLAIGAELAGAGDEVMAALERFARPFGVAFQVLDDVADEPGDDPSAIEPMRHEAARLLGEAETSLDGAPIDPRAAAALRDVLAVVRGAA